MIFVLNYLVLAWTEPTQSPPAGNVSAPLNVGNIGQSKVGGLVLNTGNATTGLVVAYGNVGIGKLIPSYKLDVNGMVGVNNNRITGVATPVDSADAVNKEYVDAASGGSSDMPMQGNILYNLYPSQYINTVPLSLPKSGCLVKITACNSAPTNLIIGADPKGRTVKQVASAAKGPQFTSSVGTNYTTHGGPACGNQQEGGGSTQWYCPTNYWCVFPNGHPGWLEGEFSGRCCPNNTQGVCDYNYCASCTTNYPLINCHGYCYKNIYNNTPCDAPVSNETLVLYDSTNDICIYCPSDHPVYDPVSQNCITKSSISTSLIGSRCSTLSTTLYTAFTDVTFANANSLPVDVSYVVVSYSCPQ